MGSRDCSQLEGGQKELSDLPAFQWRSISTPITSTNLAEARSQNDRIFHFR
jgi:hypothetical protein